MRRLLSLPSLFLVGKGIANCDPFAYLGITRSEMERERRTQVRQCYEELAVSGEHMVATCEDLWLQSR